MIKKSAGFLFLIILLLAGCKNFIGQDDNKNECQEECKPVWIIPEISLNFTEENSRTVNPTFEIQKLSDISLRGSLTGQAEETFFTGKTYAEVSAADFKIQLANAGTYNFTLTAKLNERNYSSTVSGKEIAAGDNSLAFTLGLTGQDSTFVSGTGSFGLSLTITNGTNIGYAKCCLYNADGTVAIAQEGIAKADGKFTYAKNNVAAGEYYVVFSFFENQYSQAELGYYQEIVNISKDLTSTAERTVASVSTTYTITYEKNGGDWVTNAQYPVYYSKNGASLPDKSKITKTSNILKGWYYDQSCTLKATDQNLKFQNRNITLYAGWYAGDCICSAAELPGILAGYTDTDKVYKIRITDSAPDLISISNALSSGGKKVELDLSGCTGLTEICSGAFSGCDKLYKIILPESITAIRSGAFNWCNNLANVILPESVTVIEAFAFYQCSALTEITIPKNVEEIGSGDFDGELGRVFSECTSLQRVVIQKGVKKIGVWAFYKCTSLTSITIPDSVTSIGKRAFLSCSALTSVTIPEGVTSIGERAFMDCSALTSITIPDSVTSIGERAFLDCSALTSITIPEGVTSIGECAFKDCSALTSITIPEGVTSIGKNTFDRCSALTSITIPESVTSIVTGSSASFQHLEDLAYIKAPCRFNNDDFKDRLGGSENTNFVWTHDYSADNGTKCSRCNEEQETRSGNLSSNVTYFYGVGSKKLIIRGTGPIPDHAFDASEGSESVEQCQNIAQTVEYVEIEAGITEIGKYAFTNCNALKDIKIPGTVTNIKSYFIHECNAITAIVIPEGVVFIGDFGECTALRKVTLPNSLRYYVYSGVENSEQYSIVGHLSNLFTDFRLQIENITLPCNISGSYFKIGILDVYPNRIHQYEEGSLLCKCKSEIRSGTASINQNVSYTYNAQTKTLTVNGTGPVPDSAFYLYDDNIHPQENYISKVYEKLIISNSITQIESDAFYRSNIDGNLKTLVISKNLSSVGERAFYNNGYLKEIVVSESGRIWRRIPDTTEFIIPEGAEPEEITAVNKVIAALNTGE